MYMTTSTSTEVSEHIATGYYIILHLVLIVFTVVFAVSAIYQKGTYVNSNVDIFGITPIVHDLYQQIQNTDSKNKCVLVYKYIKSAAITLYRQLHDLLLSKTRQPHAPAMKICPNYSTCTKILQNTKTLLVKNLPKRRFHTIIAPCERVLLFNNFFPLIPQPTRSYW